MNSISSFVETILEKKPVSVGFGTEEELFS